MWREEKLARLQEELKMLDVFDRVHDCETDHRNHPDNGACVSRQKRRAEILAEVAKLEVRKPWFEGLGAGTVALIICAILYATFHYLFK